MNSQVIYLFEIKQGGPTNLILIKMEKHNITQML